MIARQSRLIEIYTTPAQLREIADSLEKQWRNARLGHEVPRCKEYSKDGGLEIHFIIDQDQIKISPGSDHKLTENTP